MDPIADAHIQVVVIEEQTVANVESTHFYVVAQGEQGPQGIAGVGTPGAAGADGQGVPTGGTTGQVLGKVSNGDFDTGWLSGATPTGNANTFAFFDSSTLLVSTPGWTLSDDGVFYATAAFQPDGNAGAFNWLGHYVALDPLQDSPNETWNGFQLTVALDPNSSGFDIGTNGNAATALSLYFGHGGTSDVGGLSFLQLAGDIGNGTDPIKVKGYAYSLGFTGFHGPVEINGAMQGYIFQPGFDDPTATITGYTTPFGDYANCTGMVVSGWTGFNTSPNIGSIANNSNYHGLSITPAISTFTGNAGFQGGFIGGNLGTFGATGYYNGLSISPNITSIPNFTGININPTITTGTNATGINIDMSNANAGGYKRAIYAKGDVEIDGALSFTGALAMGQLNAFYGSAPVDGGGDPQGLHGLISSVTTGANATVANADAIGVNTAMLITLNANSTTTSGPFGLGFASLALPCVVETHTGAYLDVMSGGVFAANLVGSSTGGTIDTINLCRAVGIPNGITTVNKIRGFFYHEPFGPAATARWGYYNDAADAYTFSRGAVVIGGNDAPTNSSVAFEINSTTQAPVCPRMTTTERNALTAINGMGPIYNTDTNKFQGYAGGSWVDWH